LSELRAKLKEQVVPEFLNKREGPDDTIMSHFSPGSFLGAVSERSYESSQTYLATSASKKSTFSYPTNRKTIAKSLLDEVPVLVGSAWRGSRVHSCTERR
jgi:hypothetical protein